MENETKINDLIDKYQKTFRDTYKEIVSQKYSHLLLKFPLTKVYQYDINVVNVKDCVKDWRLIELIFTSRDKPTIGTPTHGFVVKSEDEISVEEIKKNEEAHKREVIDGLDLKDVVAHIIIYPPFEEQEGYVKKQAEKTVSEHYMVIGDDASLYQKIRGFEDGNDLIADIDEVKKCLIHKIYRSAISSICTATENAFIIRLLKEDKKIREEEKNGKLWYLSQLNKEAYKHHLITDKTFERVNILNKMRRLGMSHSKTGSTLKEDAEFALTAFRQALKELFVLNPDIISLI